MDEPLYYLDRLGSPFLFLEERRVTLAKHETREVINKFPKLVFVLEGTLRHQFIGHGLQTLQPGSIILNLGDHDHRYVEDRSRSFAELRVMRLTIMPETLKPAKRINQSADPIHSLLAKLPPLGVYQKVTGIAPWLHEASKELRISHPNSRLRVRALAELIVVDFWRKIQTQQHESMVQTNRPTTALSDRVSAYLENHLMKKVMLSDIARDVGRSEEHISRVFRQDRGRTISEELQHLRMERAKYLLLCTEKNVTLIAELCGFSALAHFSRVFRQCSGQTPTHFRKLGMHRPNS